MIHHIAWMLAQHRSDMEFLQAAKGKQGDTMTHFYGLSTQELGVDTWEKIQITEDCLLFFKDTFTKEEACDGFSFKCLSFVSSDADGSNVGYEVSFEGNVAWDGLRHLYMGSTETHNYGYLYCQDLPLLIKALQELDKLQVDKCKYVAKERANG